MKVSVVISSFNNEDKIEDCLKSVKEIAAEIIFVDNSSTDKTAEIASKYTNNIFKRENNPTMFNTNKNFGFTKATSKWILSLDSDERITPELSQEILELDEKDLNDGFFIPRKNIIFGKWIENTGWYPDYQLRLFRKSKGRFEEKHIHEFIKVEGDNVGHLSNPMSHLNYESISQFLDKMIKNYTISETESLLAKGYKFNSLDIVKMPVSEFMGRYFLRKGYKDGMHGLVLSLLMAFYHFVIFLRLWEANKYPEDANSFTLLQEANKTLKKEMKYWMMQKRIDEEGSSLKKNILKITRKVSK